MEGKYLWRGVVIVGVRSGLLKTWLKPKSESFCFSSTGFSTVFFLCVCVCAPVRKTGFPREVATDAIWHEWGLCDQKNSLSSEEVKLLLHHWVLVIFCNNLGPAHCLEKCCNLVTDNARSDFDNMATPKIQIQYYSASVPKFFEVFCRWFFFLAWVHSLKMKYDCVRIKTNHNFRSLGFRGYFCIRMVNSSLVLTSRFGTFS